MENLYTAIQNELKNRTITKYVKPNHEAKLAVTYTRKEDGILLSYVIVEGDSVEIPNVITVTPLEYATRLTTGQGFGDNVHVVIEA